MENKNSVQEKKKEGRKEWFLWELKKYQDAQKKKDNDPFLFENDDEFRDGGCPSYMYYERPSKELFKQIFGNSYEKEYLELFNEPFPISVNSMDLLFDIFPVGLDE